MLGWLGAPGCGAGVGFTLRKALGVVCARVHLLAWGLHVCAAVPRAQCEPRQCQQCPRAPLPAAQHASLCMRTSASSGLQEVNEAPKVMGPDALLKQKIKQKRFRCAAALGGLRLAGWLVLPGCAGSVRVSSPLPAHAAMRMLSAAARLACTLHTLRICPCTCRLASEG